ncbi:MAG: sulfite exporter TauE/SafE family protein [Bacteroidota bacterium]
MSLGTVLILVAIGVAAGMLSGFIGVGGGVIVVPALIYFLGLSQFEAQGTSLAMMIPPIGFLGVMNYYQKDAVNIKYSIIIALFFVIGAYFGSKISLKLPPAKVKFIFGILMLYVAIRMVWTSSKQIFFSDGL